ncbi:MAG: hypothetical protein ACYC5N_03020 [Endomicrobiales bacterium]
MIDSLTGVVSAVTSCDTFKMNITTVSADNPKRYGSEASILIDNFLAQEASGPGQGSSKEALEAKLKDRKVRCFVKGRDSSGNFLSDVMILS